eukprot:15348513-Heterocapsa_arctica.AAC.1
MLKLPAIEVKMSISLMTDFIVATRKPFMEACSAQIGSISVMSTRALAPRSAKAQPLLTST